MLRSPGDWLSDVQGMQKEMERLLDYLGSSKPPSVHFARMWEPAVDVYETATEVVVLVELAGVKESDIEIVVNDNSVLIRGQRKEGALREKRKYYQMEIHRGPFQRSILLPARVDTNKTKASFENGILEIVLTKVQQERILRVDIRTVDQF